MYAAEEVHTNIVVLLLRQEGIDINNRDVFKSFKYRICTKCKDEYGVIRKASGNKIVGQCEKCPKDCLYCNYDSTFCSICDDESDYIDDQGYGYIIGSDGSYTGKCGSCPNNCYKCDDVSTCAKCREGYGFILDNNGNMTGKCGPCGVANCEYCYFDTKICGECQYGFGFARDNNGVSALVNVQNAHKIVKNAILM